MRYIGVPQNMLRVSVATAKATRKTGIRPADECSPAPLVGVRVWLPPIPPMTPDAEESAPRVFRPPPYTRTEAISKYASSKFDGSRT